MNLSPRLLIIVLATAGILGIGYLGYWSWFRQDFVSNVTNSTVVQVNTPVNVNADKPSCTSILDEKTCTSRVDCFGMYGPSFCENGSCSQDEEFKGCDTNYVYSNCIYTGGTWDATKKLASEQCRCPVGKSFTLQGYQCEVPASKEDTSNNYIASNPGILDQACPKEMLAERKNAYNPYISWVVNDRCSYDYSTHKQDDRYGKVDNCASTLEEEISKRKFTIINSCLYNDKIRVFDKTLHSQIVAGEFGKTNLAAKFNEDIGSIGEMADEWFRYELGDEITIFFRGGAGCGGCVFNGPYLTINKVSGKVIKKGVNWAIPYLPNLVLSPDHTKAIEFTSLESQQNREMPITGKQPKALFYLYDFVTLERKQLLFEYAVADAVLTCGHGCYLADGVVTWKDDNTVSFQIYKIDPNESGQLLLGTNGKYLPDGLPKIVKINK